MELHLNTPDLQVKVERWMAETGRSPDELGDDVIDGYFRLLDHMRDQTFRP
ncbi:MAG: hypothetical protein JO057_02260 [Chloroflexi bacterium]|nr:hypothetical protein [Chloroflexota bacterium]